MLVLMVYWNVNLSPIIVQLCEILPNTTKVNALDKEGSASYAREIDFKIVSHLQAILVDILQECLQALWL